jgi:hypothetical protein
MTSSRQPIIPLTALTLYPEAVMAEALFPLV